MNIITGASGQVGSALVKELNRNGMPVTAVIRNQSKANIFDSNVKVRIADVFDAESLIKAFHGGETVFLLTPENFHSEDVLGDGQRIIAAYRKAIQQTGIRRIIGLSSMGAHLGNGTGNLMISHWLEEAFEYLPVETTFIRPAYYFSNWLAYADVVKEYGILPTFFEPEQKIPMVSPQDIARFAASICTNPTFTTKVFELTGPQDYSTQDVARVYAKYYKREVVPNRIPREEWVQTLISAGFSTDAAQNMAAMTATLVDGEDKPKSDIIPIKLETGLEDYIRNETGKRDIDAYIAASPEETHARLNEIRYLILQTVPQLQETISWGMPTFKLQGKNLAHFATHKHHLGFYPGEEAIVVFKARLVDYKTSKGAVQLPWSKPFPKELIRDILLWQAEQFS
ncbi:uncharacterized protein YbjT (DUF2867 family)/uncharacterized protein YdhG (YjbR/CyaY superfamily) [Parabacteroides sp. PF5-5]|uniref:NmrA family NAD(P)-binding protein n=1 Tax=unclassified Parabacteroides TaxID=2649774 RepID=UPI002474269A|nr:MULTISPECIES: NAD(P)H-binding protein [unclassified Parabacteroides]MDH6303677.1 uncharacterized protein YbjT (DUF2867 family)/uncharacterized protein YdhG (YjbR/CyaY superfamily) [Parabacteroides sp. PH5-39]MDH6314294.1 uncharacterized protein YbjT (DUF2867 family)/uncharacterized protein YdhG (YjbR/CyaY superfamily) [Parabacteroides sp. PF5-13]MDH6318642.1 uncharacterized protein YbjT (DUF2867 family)/uncharacterized protein YdhG (YjbR/CyaY superfamily) [Parabacteroides sp. PH5-13]MDH63220